MNKCITIFNILHIQFVWQGQVGELDLTGQAPGLYYKLLQGKDGRRYGGKLVLMGK